MKQVIAALLPVVIVFLALELLARVAATVKSDVFGGDPELWYEYSNTLGWTRSPDFRGSMECGVGRDFDASGYRSADTSQVDLHSEPKVVFLGDSTTMGFCVETGDSFVERVDAMLPNASAINLGLNGYTSYQGYQVLRETGARLQPDLVVVSFNFNDRRYVLDASQADSPGAFEATLQAEERKRLLLALERSYLVGGLRFVLKSIGLIEEPVIPSTVDLQTLLPRVTLDQYKENLGNIVTWARENDSDVLFMVLGDNPARTERLHAGIAHLQANELDAAAEEFWVTRRDEWFSDLARLQQAKLYRATGRMEDAERVTKAESYWSLHGGRPIVLDTVYNDAMRELARAQGVEVVEASAVLNDYPGIFIDNAHFDARGHGLVADLLVGPIRSLLAE